MANAKVKPAPLTIAPSGRTKRLAVAGMRIPCSGRQAGLGQTDPLFLHDEHLHYGAASPG